MPETHKDKPLPGKTNSEVDITDQKTHQAHIAEQNQIKSIGGRQEVKNSTEQKVQAIQTITPKPRILLGTEKKCKKNTNWVVEEA